MTHTVFYIFATIMLAFGMLVVINRNPVSSAMSLVVSFIGLAALFITLDAFFIGIIQILVYAGAVMVLFLFIIMLMDIRAEKRRRINYTVFGGGILLTVALCIQIVSVISNFAPGAGEIPRIDHKAAAAERIAERKAAGLETSSDDVVSKSLLEDGSLPDVHLVGETLFTKFNFPFQIVGVLLVVSTIGVVVLSKKHLT